jgi:hypothetical protein
MPQIYQVEAAFGTYDDPSMAPYVSGKLPYPTNYHLVKIGQPKVWPIIFTDAKVWFTTAWWMPIQGIGGLTKFDRIEFIQPDGYGNTDPNQGFVDMYVDVISPGFIKIMVYATSDLPPTTDFTDSIDGGGSPDSGGPTDLTD